MLDLYADAGRSFRVGHADTDIENERNFMKFLPIKMHVIRGDLIL